MNRSSGIPKATLFYSVSPNGFYQESILVFSCQKTQLRWNIRYWCIPKNVQRFFCIAGFCPGSRPIVWRIPEGATIVVEGKVGNNGRALRDAPGNSTLSPAVERRTEERTTLGPDSRRRIMRKGC
jgi:hypothetical protein